MKRAIPTTPSLPVNPISAHEPFSNGVKQRHYGRRWEVDILQLSAEFVDDFTESKGDIRKLWQKTFVIVVWKRGEKPVLARLGSPYKKHA